MGGVPSRLAPAIALEQLQQQVAAPRPPRAVVGRHDASRIQYEKPPGSERPKFTTKGGTRQRARRSPHAPERARGRGEPRLPPREQLPCAVSDGTVHPTCVPRE